MIEIVKKYIEQHQMFPQGCRVVVALSGGADSVCLLRVLDSLKEHFSLRLQAVHVHHGLRGAEADRDAVFSEELCGKLKIPCKVVYCNMNEYAAEHGLSPEEAGRRLRYEAFLEVAGTDQDARIAVAHHMDDDAETILHNLLRGSGLKGLGGIQPVRDRIVRPLLCVERQEILNYLKEQYQDFCQDSTNEENDYTRNRIRNQLIPLAETVVNEHAKGNILRAGMMIRQADAYIDKKASEYLVKNQKWENGRLAVLAEDLLLQEPVIQSYVIMKMIEKMCGARKDITSTHVEQVQSLLKKQVGKMADLPYGLNAIRDYQGLSIGPQSKKVAEKTKKPVFPVEMTVFSYEKSMEFPKNQYTKWFDYGKIKGTLSVRTRQTGDFLLLPSGGRKTVKSYMIDEKIPSDMRGQIPLLADGNHILWIIGYRISEYYKITDQTNTVLQVQFDGGKNDGR